MTDDAYDPDEEQQTRSKAPLLVVLILAATVGGVVGGLWLTPGGKEFLAGLVNDGSAESGEEQLAEEEGHEAPTLAPETEEKHAAAPAEDSHDVAESDGKLSVSPFKEIIVNINATTATGRSTSRFMKMNIALVYDSHLPGAERIEERRLFLRDSFQDYLRQLNERDLRGSVGLMTIKQDLLHRARTITDSDAPREMLVSDLIVQ